LAFALTAPLAVIGYVPTPLAVVAVVVTAGGVVRLAAVSPFTNPL
jgi:hypothetical protein